MGGLTPSDKVSGYRENADAANYETLKAFSRSNRHQPTEAENVLWQLLRGNTTGFKIRRQHVIGNYIADFVCLQKMLVFEVDGEYHKFTSEADDLRTEILSDLGFEIVRIKNADVLISPDKVFNFIVTKINNTPQRKALPSGEGLGGADFNDDAISHSEEVQP
ncbi:endonuclease domain-containing protein [Mucilaginibacter ginkgonis]|nr:DUF559 domain-containing protein [Mucilaginibacter ginkgonis]